MYIIHSYILTWHTDYFILISLFFHFFLSFFSTIPKGAFLMVEQTGILRVIYIRLDFNEQMNKCDNSLDSHKHYLLGIHFNSEG